MMKLSKLGRSYDMTRPTDNGDYTDVLPRETRRHMIQRLQIGAIGVVRRVMSRDWQLTQNTGCNVHHEPFLCDQEVFNDHACRRIKSLEDKPGSLENPDSAPPWLDDVLTIRMTQRCPEHGHALNDFQGHVKI